MQDHNLPQNSQISHPTPNEFDYTFTDKELQDILGFMEHQAGGQDAAVASVPPPFMSGPPPSGLGLQFQPHIPPVQSGSTLAALPYDQSSNAGVKREVAVSSTGFAPAFANSNGFSLAGAHSGTRSNAYAPGISSVHMPERRSSLQQIQGTSSNRQDKGQQCAIYAICESMLLLYMHQSTAMYQLDLTVAEPRQHISHSTVEKQRRDRINSLIDEVYSPHFLSQSACITSSTNISFCCS